MKWKKIIIMLLVTAVAVSTISGCSSTGKKKEGNEDIAMGRYVEKVIKMPAAVEAGDEIAYQMLKDPEGKPQILCDVIKPKNGVKTVIYTLNKNNTWQRSVPKWLLSLKGDIYIAYAPDGTRYAKVSKNGKDKCIVHIYKSTDGEKSEEVSIDDFKNPVDYKKEPMGIAVLSDNSFLFPGYDTCSVYKEGKAVTSFETGDYNYAYYGNTMMVLNKKMNGVIFVNLKTGKTISELSFKSSNMINAFAADKDSWYMVNQSGIHRLAKGGSTWETIVDGSLASMSVPSLYPEKLLKGSKEDYYVMFQSENGKRVIRHYVYDKDVPTTPSKTLSVVSLYDNLTVRQAILEYQQKHQDVKVDYKAVMCDEDGTTVSDHIKAINTELLARKGADVYILDDMPVDSYIEKGVLADISDIIKPLVDKGVILKNVIKSYEQDGKIYSAPIRVMPTFAFGKKEAVKASASIKTLAEYAKNQASLPLMGANSITYSDLTTYLFHIYSGSFRDKKGRFNKEGLIEFLKDLKIISDQTNAFDRWPKGCNYADMNNINEYTSQLIYDHRAELALTSIPHMYCVYCPIAILDKVGGSYSTINHEYYARGLIGMNNAGKQKKLAAEFIKELYSEKVQKAQLGDGFPVNIKALDNYAMDYDDFLIGLDKFEVTQPSKEKMKRINDLCKTLTTPIKSDQVMFKMVLNEIIPYLKGKAGLSETADRILQKTQTYLEE